MKAAIFVRYSSRWSYSRQILRSATSGSVGKHFPATVQNVAAMSGEGASAAGRSYVVRRGANGPTVTYRLFDNAAHGLEPEFRLLGLADMKG